MSGCGSTKSFCKAFFFGPKKAPRDFKMSLVASEDSPQSLVTAVLAVVVLNCSQRVKST